MRYDGPHDENELRRFIFEVANKIENKDTFTKGVVKENEKEIPAYCLGHPIYGDAKKKRCYLEFDDAYTK